VITGLWARRRRSFDFDGTYYQVSNSPGLLGPKRLLPIIIGGGGPARTPTSPPVRG
jgi:alkanesulfonate monooxygenase SsuD/methylene tetrahydromethanopterin reductase-like flavin-dependent oxidoreductase (luciferase family)